MSFSPDLEMGTAHTTLADLQPHPTNQASAPVAHHHFNRGEFWPLYLPLPPLTLCSYSLCSLILSRNLGPALVCAAELAAQEVPGLLLAFPESLFLVPGLPLKRGSPTSVCVEVWCLAMGSYSGSPVRSNSGVWGCSVSRIAGRMAYPRSCVPVWG